VLTSHINNCRLALLPGDTVGGHSDDGAAAHCDDVDIAHDDDDDEEEDDEDDDTDNDNDGASVHCDSNHDKNFEPVEADKVLPSPQPPHVTLTRAASAPSVGADKDVECVEADAVLPPPPQPLSSLYVTDDVGGGLIEMEVDDRAISEKDNRAVADAALPSSPQPQPHATDDVEGDAELPPVQPSQPPPHITADVEVDAALSSPLQQQPPHATLSLKETRSIFSAIAPEWHKIKNTPEAERYHLAAAEAMEAYWCEMKVYADTNGCDECILRAANPKYLDRLVAHQLQVIFYISLFV
jgi:hypothetical protein